MIVQIVWIIAAILLVINIILYNITCRKLTKRCNKVLNMNDALIKEIDRLIDNDGRILTIVKDLQDKVYNTSCKDN